MVNLQPISTDQSSSDSTGSSSPPLPSPTSHLPPHFPILPPLLPHLHFSPQPPFRHFFFLPPPYPFYYILYPDPPPQPYYPLHHDVIPAAQHGGVRRRSKAAPRRRRGGGETKKVWGLKKASGPHSPPPHTPPPTVDCTTVMVKNIPNKLSRKALMHMLDNHCRDQNQKSDSNSRFEYDFLYLPFDFVHKMNVGYAFVNFTTVEGASALSSCWNGKGWHNSPKTRLITRARVQGIEQCKKHFQNSEFCCQSEEYLPVEFTPPRDGSNDVACKISCVGSWAYMNRPRRGEQKWSSQKKVMGMSGRR